jgi:hypothetical protein
MNWDDMFDLMRRRVLRPDIDGAWINSSERTTPESLRDLRPVSGDFTDGRERERKTEKEDRS